MSLEYAIERPTLLLTFDTELLWGAPGAVLHADARKAARATRDVVMPALLSMLDELQIPATFAVVGHLLCKPGECGRPTGEGDSPAVRNWYEAIPRWWAKMPECFYWPELVEMILERRTRHEIGLHSLTHWRFDSKETSDALAKFELRENLRLLVENGAPPPRSMVFPCNGVGHIAALAASGVTAYRSLERPWYSSVPPPLCGVGHLVDAALALVPPVYGAIRRSPPGPWEIPGSWLFLSAASVRRMVPTASRSRQMLAGWRRAVSASGLLHIWTHPINLGSAPIRQLAALRRGLEGIMGAQDDGARVLTMSQLAAEAEAAAGAGGGDG